jgi:hypothetical protein
MVNIPFIINGLNVRMLLRVWHWNNGRYPLALIPLKLPAAARPQRLLARLTQIFGDNRSPGSARRIRISLYIYG